MTRPGADVALPDLAGRLGTTSSRVSTCVNGHEMSHSVPIGEHIGSFAAVPSKVREARRFLTAILAGCPVADDAILCLSELASNCVVHSASREPGGTFTVKVQVVHGYCVRIELIDNGGPWIQHPNEDDRPHGLAIVQGLAAESGVRGDALTGWISWVTLNWDGNGRAARLGP